MRTLAALVALVALVTPASAFAETLAGKWKLVAAEDLRFDGNRMLYGPAPNSIRAGPESLTRRLTLERP